MTNAFLYACTQNQVIKFETFEMPGPPSEPIILTPENDNWSEIIRKLADLQVDKWEADYSDPSVLDGVGWSLTVRATEFNIQSSGLNAYPPKFGAVKKVIEESFVASRAQMQTSRSKASYRRKPRKCPNCGSATAASILYGMPNPSEELIKKEQRGEIVFGGCVIELDGNQPSWQCPKCEMSFYKTTLSER